MRYLNALDYGIISLYGAVLLVMGVYLWRKASASMEDYFLAGRNLPWWALGISGMTNFLDMTGTMVIVSFLYMMGPRGLFVEFRGGAVLVLAFMMLWTGKWHYRSKCMTGAEWQIFRFGTGAGAQAARIITAVATIVLSIGMIAYLIKGAGIFLSMFLPFTPLTCAVLMVGLTTIYTIVSGFYGVVYNDLFQSGVILLSVIVISVMALSKLAAYDGDLGTLAQEVTGNPAWMSSFPHRFTPMPEGYKEFEWLRYIAFFYLLRNILGGLGTGADPRYFGARNERECGILTFFWTSLMMFRWPMMIGFAVLGLFLVHENYPDPRVLTTATGIVRQDPSILARYGMPTSDEKAIEVPKHRWEEVLAEIAQRPEEYPALAARLSIPSVLGSDWASRIQMASYEGTPNPERVLPAVILMWIPAGLRGLFIASLLAAAMSTLSPQVNTTTAFFTKDIWQAYLRKRASNRELITVSYAFGILLVVLGFIMAFKAKNINDIWDWIIMALGAGFAVPLALRLYWWRFNGAGVFRSTFAALVGAIVQRVYFTMLHPDLKDWSPDKKFLILTGLATLGAIIGTYLSPPTDRPTLEHFYRTTRPFGFWGPLRGSLSARVRRAMDRENAIDIVCLPFALLWQITLFLLPMQLLIGNYQQFVITLVLFLGSLSVLMLLWYRNLPPKATGITEATALVLAEDAAAGRIPPGDVPLDVAGEPVTLR